MTIGTPDRPHAQLSGENGNTLNLLGIAKRALRLAGQNDEAAKMTERVFKCGSREEALAIIEEYVEVE